MSPISSTTRLLTLLGKPVAHSRSPTIQNAAFAAGGVDGVYVALECTTQDLPGVMGALARAGGGGNVTLPHKEKAAAVLDVRSDAVRRTGACNTFWGEDGVIHGDNTDVEGFRRAFRKFMNGSTRGQRVLLLGAGGAARAALVGLLDEGVGEVRLLNRTAERARAVARRIGGEQVRVIDTPSGVDDEAFDLVVNATSLGLGEHDELPLDLSRLSRVGGVMDLLYGPSQTAFVRAAREVGIRATDGSEMLIQQGAVAFERWWGTEPPVDAMRKALEAHR